MNDSTIIFFLLILFVLIILACVLRSIYYKSPASDQRKMDLLFLARYAPEYEEVQVFIKKTLSTKNLQDRTALAAFFKANEMIDKWEAKRKVNEFLEK